jgi:S1-C subfamily serine protease
VRSSAVHLITGGKTMRFLGSLLIYAALLSCLFLSSSVIGQDETLTNTEIVSLTKAGIDKTVIISKIHSSATKFDLTTDALIQLKQAGVADEVVAAMISPKPTTESAKPVRLKDELTSNFNRLKTSVVTVWSEFGHGTGFIFDKDGLVMTNQHVVGPSQYITVQFDSKTKISAVLLAASPEKDVAILWIDLASLPESSLATFAASDTSEPSVAEGERVFTIGSPLDQKKIITTGIASKVEERAIISDININPGNSGGPLFNSIGQVVGITTFGEQDSHGPGIAGVVRVEQAMPLIDEAKKRMKAVTKPAARLLPVEPVDTFPLDAIKEVATAKKFDENPYSFGVDNFNVVMLTPLVIYRIATEAEREAAKAHEKRTKKEGAIKGSYQPFDEFRGWREYVGDYKPVLLIQATPELAESFWGAFGRGLAANYGIHAQAKLHFKSDFHRMKLFCGDREIEPFQPGKIPFLKNQSDYFISVQDASFVGLYAYPADAISSSCGKVRLEVYSEKEPEKAHTKELDKKTVERIALDFAPYLMTKTEKIAQVTNRTVINEQTEIAGKRTTSTMATKSKRNDAVGQKDSAQTDPTDGNNQKEIVIATTGSSIAVKSTPEGADIEVDGKFVGSTPSTVHLDAGDHRITVKKKGYTVWERTMGLNAGSSVVVDAALQEEAPPPAPVPVRAGTATLSTQPMQPAPAR